jgi:hypothetical protein
MTMIDLVLTIFMAIIVAIAAHTKNQNSSTPSLSTCSLPETQTGTPGTQTHASVSAGATTSTITCYCHHQYPLRPYKPAYRRKAATALTIQPIRHPRVFPSVSFAATNTDIRCEHPGDHAILVECVYRRVWKLQRIEWEWLLYACGVQRQPDILIKFRKLLVKAINWR